MWIYQFASVLNRVGKLAGDVCMHRITNMFCRGIALLRICLTVTTRPINVVKDLFKKEHGLIIKTKRWKSWVHSARPFKITSWYYTKSSQIDGLLTWWLGWGFPPIKIKIILRNRAEYRLIQNQGIFRKIKPDNSFLLFKILITKHSFIAKKLETIFILQLFVYRRISAVYERRILSTPWPYLGGVTMCCIMTPHNSACALWVKIKI